MSVAHKAITCLILWRARKIGKADSADVFLILLLGISADIVDFIGVGYLREANFQVESNIKVITYKSFTSFICYTMFLMFCNRYQIYCWVKLLIFILSYFSVSRQNKAKNNFFIGFVFSRKKVTQEYRTFNGKYYLMVQGVDVFKVNLMFCFQILIFQLKFTCIVFFNCHWSLSDLEKPYQVSPCTAVTFLLVVE